MTDKEAPLGVRHAHVFTDERSVTRLQSAHDSLRWDVSKSRLLAFAACSVCGEIDRSSVSECTASDCREHAVCRRPYR